MQVRRLNKVVLDACDLVRDASFQETYLSGELPRQDLWIVDLKTGKGRDGRSYRISLPFGEMLRDWFLCELQTAGIPLVEVGSAELALGFNFVERQPVICRCTVVTAAKTYTKEVTFYPGGGSGS